MLINGFLVFLGGGIGSLVRYIVNIVTQMFTINQAGTLLVNTVGSFYLDFLLFLQKIKVNILIYFFLLEFWEDLQRFHNFLMMF